MQLLKMLALTALLTSCVSIPKHPREEICTLWVIGETLVLCSPASAVQNQPQIERPLTDLEGATCRRPDEDAKHISYVKALESELKRVKDEVKKRSR